MTDLVNGKIEEQKDVDSLKMLNLIILCVFFFFFVCIKPWET